MLEWDVVRLVRIREGRRDWSGERSREMRQSEEVEVRGGREIPVVRLIWRWPGRDTEGENGAVEAGRASQGGFERVSRTTG